MGNVVSRKLRVTNPLSKLLIAADCVTAGPAPFVTGNVSSERPVFCYRE